MGVQCVSRYRTCTIPLTSRQTARDQANRSAKVAKVTGIMCDGIRLGRLCFSSCLVPKHLPPIIINHAKPIFCLAASHHLDRQPLSGEKPIGRILTFSTAQPFFTSPSNKTCSPRSFLSYTHYSISKPPFFLSPPFIFLNRWPAALPDMLQDSIQRRQKAPLRRRLWTQTQWSLRI